MSPDEIRQYGIKNRLPKAVIYKMLEKYHYLPDAGVIQRDNGVPLLYRHSVRESYLLFDNYKEESKIYFSRIKLRFYKNEKYF